MKSEGKVIHLSAGASYSPLDLMLLFEIIHQTGKCFIMDDSGFLLTERSRFAPECTVNFRPLSFISVSGDVSTGT